MKYKQWWMAAARIWAYRLLLTAAFLAPFSLPAGRLFLALSLGFLLYARIRHGEPIYCTRVGWLWLAFVLVSLLVSLQGIDPQRSVGDISKLLWFAGIPAAATLITDRHRASMLLVAYVNGSIVRSLDILLLRLPGAWRQTENAFMHEIIHRGSMTHGQVLLLAMIGVFGLLLMEIIKRGGWKVLAIKSSQFVLLTLAMLVNFKRGSWVAVTVILVLFGVLTGKKRILLLLLLVVLAGAFHPFVRARMSHLRNELDIKHGGRLVMWTKIAPALLREHPYGVGFRGVTPEVMQETARAQGVRVEERRNHLHSNLVEIPVTVGWVAFLLYVLWMGTALWKGSTAAWHAGDPLGRILALTYTLMLFGLILNGFVEYNMGDAYIVLPYGILLGVLGRGTLGAAARLSELHPGS